MCGTHVLFSARLEPMPIQSVLMWKNSDRKTHFTLGLKTNKSDGEGEYVCCTLTLPFGRQR